MLDVLLAHVQIDYAGCKELKTQPMDGADDTFRNLVGFVDGRLAPLYNLDKVVGRGCAPIEALRGQNANQLRLSECSSKVHMVA